MANSHEIAVTFLGAYVVAAIMRSVQKQNNLKILQKLCLMNHKVRNLKV